MDRFFSVVQRINSVLMLLVLLGAAALLIFISSESKGWQRHRAVEIAPTGTGDKKPILVSFDRAEEIIGSNTQLLKLTTQEMGSKFSSGGYGPETRNVLFLNGEEKAARWLFKDNKSLFLTVAQLHEQSSKKEDAPTKALYFEYVSNDTDGDGNLSSADHSNVGLAKPDGTGFIAIVTNANRVFSYDLIGTNMLSIVFQKEGKVRHLRISIPGFKIMSTQEIVDVPNTL
jgi:hypothetical protein